jgi:hypothetical protein
LTRESTEPVDLESESLIGRSLFAKTIPLRAGGDWPRDMQIDYASLLQFSGDLQQ